MNFNYLTDEQIEHIKTVYKDKSIPWEKRAYELGKEFNVEIDTLFVTALLTVIGFSVHDTIVVFDRIRENLPKNLSRKFSDIADISITQTLARSLNTSLTVVFVLLALLLFGGETIKWFVVALLVGIISGTYSSIFNATALLAWWEERLGH